MSKLKTKTNTNSNSNSNSGVKPTKSRPKKRPYEPSPSAPSPSPKKSMRQDERFTFEDVKILLDSLLEQDKKKLETNVNNGVKKLDFQQASNLNQHSVEACQELLDKLVDRTRTIRTTEEVLRDIRENLNKRLYTDIIQRFGLTREPPRRPASSYFLFHKKRFPELRDQLLEEYEEWARDHPGSQERKAPNASTIAVKVSEEWRAMGERERDYYQKLHNDLVKKYEKDIKKLGLTHIEKPKRPKSARHMYIQSKLAEMDPDMNEKKLAKMKKLLREEFDQAEPEIKGYWKALAKEELVQYNLDTQKFCEENPHLDRDNIIKVRKKKVKITPPAAPRNPFRIYMDKKIPADLEGKELEDFKAKLKEKFNRLSLKKLLKCIKKAIKEQEQYEVDVAKFLAEHPDFPPEKIRHPKPTVTKAQWKLYESHVEGKPVPPAATAYLHYCSKLMNNMNDPDQKPTERLQTASAAWLALSQAEKADAYKEHIECMKQFIDEMQEWLAKQKDERIERLFREDPKSKPDSWRRRVAKMERVLAKREFD